MAENIFDNLEKLCSDNKNIYQQLGDIHNALNQMATIFQAKAEPTKENDNRKYYKLSAKVKFSTYYTYVVANDFSELKKEIEKFASDLQLSNSDEVAFSEVSVEDCLQAFVEQYEKKIQKWYFRSRWDVSQGKNDAMNNLFDEIKNAPLFHTYSAFQKWDQFESYRERLLLLCAQRDVSARSYREYLNRLEKATDIRSEYERICQELTEETQTTPSQLEQRRGLRRSVKRDNLKPYSYDIEEDNLRLVFWEAEYCDQKTPFELPESIGYILTDAKLNILGKSEFNIREVSVEEIKKRIEKNLSKANAIIFGWPADFMSLPRFFEADTYVKCDMGLLFKRALGSNAHLPLDKITQIISQKDETNGSSIADAQQILTEFKLLCNLRGDSPCDMIRYFQLELL